MCEIRNSRVPPFSKNLFLDLVKLQKKDHMSREKSDHGGIGTSRKVFVIFVY